jgi:hypothetical protein
MKIHWIHDLSDRPVVDLLKDNLSKITDTNIIKNYHPDYSNQPGNLFYILKQGRYDFDKGKYYVITDDSDKYVCSAGWNEYELDTCIALILTRMYVVEEYRCQFILGNLVLPLMISETHQYRRRWITANVHNHSIYKFFERAAQGKTTSLFRDWPELYKQFKPIGQHTVYYTNQWVAEYQE